MLELIKRLYTKRVKHCTPARLDFEDVIGKVGESGITVYPKSTHSIKCRQVTSTSKSLIYRVDLNKGSEIICTTTKAQEVVLLVMSGKITNLSTKFVTRKMKMVELKSDVVHKLLALEDSTLYVEFKPLNV